jgi:imidazolonepropionase-like amidohydrolase
VLGPKLWVAGPQIAGRPDENALVATTDSAARAAVRTVQAGGYDFVKITNFITPPVYEAVIHEARQLGIRVVGHVPPSVGIHRALQTGEQIEHLDSFFEAVLADSAPMRVSVTQYEVFRNPNWASLDYIDDAKIDRLAGEVARSGVFVGPTQQVFNTAFAIGETDSAIMNRPDWNLWPVALREGYLRARARYWNAEGLAAKTDARRKRYVEVRNRLVKAINDSGGIIMAGSDTPEWFHTYGWGLHRELQALVAAGLTPFEALRAGTVLPARFLGAPDWGTLEPGKRADLVLLSSNPLEDIRNTAAIEAVVFGGRWLDRAALAAMVSRGEQAVH